MEEYEYISTLGEGAYGYVWRCQERSTGRIVAIKSFKQAHTEPEIMKLALREVRMLQGLDHPAVVHLLDAFKSKSGRVYMVFPYVGRSAFQELDDYPEGLPPQRLKLLVWQLCQALVYLHRQKVVHRDIKPANVLISNTGQVQLCDFGFARSVQCGPRGAQRMSSYVVTRWYRSPEVLLSEEYGPAADIWSLGCTVAELASGQPLFPGKSTVDQLWRIMRCFGDLPPSQAARVAVDPRLEPLRRVPLGGRSLRERLPGHADHGAMRLLEACLQLDPQRRCTAEELLQLPYFWSVPRLLAGSPLEAVYGRESAAALAIPTPQQRPPPPPPQSLGANSSGSGAGAGNGNGGSAAAAAAAAPAAPVAAVAAAAPSSVVVEEAAAAGTAAGVEVALPPVPTTPDQLKPAALVASGPVGGGATARESPTKASDEGERSAPLARRQSGGCCEPSESGLLASAISTPTEAAAALAPAAATSVAACARGEQPVPVPAPAPAHSEASAAAAAPQSVQSQPDSGVGGACPAVHGPHPHPLESQAVQLQQQQKQQQRDQTEVDGAAAVAAAGAPPAAPPAAAAAEPAAAAAEAPAAVGVALEGAPSLGASIASGAGGTAASSGNGTAGFGSFIGPVEARTLEASSGAAAPDAPVCGPHLAQAPEVHVRPEPAPPRVRRQRALERLGCVEGQPDGATWPPQPEPPCLLQTPIPQPQKDAREVVAALHVAPAPQLQRQKEQQQEEEEAREVATAGPAGRQMPSGNVGGDGEEAQAVGTAAVSQSAAAAAVPLRLEVEPAAAAAQPPAPAPPVPLAPAADPTAGTVCAAVGAAPAGAANRRDEDAAAAAVVVAAGVVALRSGHHATWGFTSPSPSPSGQSPWLTDFITGGLIDTPLARALESAGGGGGAGGCAAGLSSGRSTLTSVNLHFCDTATFENMGASSPSAALARLRAGPPAPGPFSRAAAASAAAAAGAATAGFNLPNSLGSGMSASPLLSTTEGYMLCVGVGNNDATGEMTAAAAAAAVRHQERQMSCQGACADRHGMLPRACASAAPRASPGMVVAGAGGGGGGGADAAPSSYGVRSCATTGDGAAEDAASPPLGNWVLAGAGGGGGGAGGGPMTVSMRRHTASYLSGAHTVTVAALQHNPKPFPVSASSQAGAPARAHSQSMLGQCPAKPGSARAHTPQRPTQHRPAAGARPAADCDQASRRASYSSLGGRLNSNVSAVHPRKYAGSHAGAGSGRLDPLSEVEVAEAPPSSLAAAVAADAAGGGEGRAAAAAAAAAAGSWAAAGGGYGGTSSSSMPTSETALAAFPVARGGNLLVAAPGGGASGVGCKAAPALNAVRPRSRLGSFSANTGEDCEVSPGLRAMSSLEGRGGGGGGGGRGGGGAAPVGACAGRDREQEETLACASASLGGAAPAGAQQGLPERQRSAAVAEVGSISTDSGEAVAAALLAAAAADRADAGGSKNMECREGDNAKRAVRDNNTYSDEKKKKKFKGSIARLVKKLAKKLVS